MHVQLTTTSLLVALAASFSRRTSVEWSTLTSAPSKTFYVSCLRTWPVPTITTHAERILAAQDPEWLEEAAGNIEATMRSRWKLTVEPSRSFRSRGAGGWCDGTSITRSGLVLYRPTGSRRDRFTLAHELGHNLVDADEECLIWLGDREDVDRDFEQVCDVIASRILIPGWRLDTVLGGGPPTAQSLRQLYENSEASWSCCAIALAGRLPCDGFVSIIDRRDDTVFFGARTRDTLPYAWAGDPLPPTHPLRREEILSKCKSFWPGFNMNERRTYYMSAEANGDYVHAVFAVNDLWNVEKLHVGPKPVRGSRPILSGTKATSPARHAATSVPLCFFPAAPARSRPANDAGSVAAIGRTRSSA